MSAGYRRELQPFAVELDRTYPKPNVPRRIARMRSLATLKTAEK